jgi:hypothetical protein
MLADKKKIDRKIATAKSCPSEFARDPSDAPDASARTPIPVLKPGAMALRGWIAPADLRLVDFARCDEAAPIKLPKTNIQFGLRTDRDR